MKLCRKYYSYKSGILFIFQNIQFPKHKSVQIICHQAIYDKEVCAFAIVLIYNIFIILAFLAEFSFR